MSRRDFEYLKFLLLIVMIAIPLHQVYGGVDVLSAGGEEYLAWSQGDSSTVKINGSSVARSFHAPMIFIGQTGPDFQNLLVSVGLYGPPSTVDSLFVLDKNSLETVMSSQIDPEELVGAGLLSGIKVARHDAGDTGIWVSGRILDPVVSPYNMLVSARYVPDSACGITLDSVLWDFYDIPEGGWAFSRHLFCNDQDNPSLFGVYGGGLHGSWIYDMCSYVHQPMLKDGMLDYYSICQCYSYYNSTPIYIKAAGSCTGEILGLWARTDTLGIYCSYLNGLQSAPTETSLLPFDLPVEKPWAMSCNREDNGLLLTWIDNGNVLCRYYENGWNADVHQIATGVGNVDEDFLSVCSDSLGYWIAWLDDQRSDPELVFMPRDSVTSIEQQEGSQQDLAVEPLNNPCSSMIRLQVSSELSENRIEVFDASGRLVHRGIAGTEEEYVFPIQIKGVYLVRVTAGSESAVCSVVAL